jgi:hypothetical protein
VEDSIQKNKPIPSKGYVDLEEVENNQHQENDDNNDEQNNKNYDSSSVNNKDTMVRFSDIVIKFFIKHIDKITLIFIYLIAIEKVNIIHFCKKYLIF